MKIKKHYIIFSTILLLLMGGNCYAQDEEADTVTSGHGNYISVESPTKRFLPVSESDNKPAAERKVNRKQFEKLRNNDAFWYVNEAREKPKDVAPSKESFLAKLLRQSWLGPLIWTLVIVGFVAILVWFLMAGDVRLFRKPPSNKKVVVTDDIPDNIFEINFENAIAAAVKAGDLRLAVRLNYLHLLKELAERNIIHFSQQRPDSDYVMQLHGSTYYDQFFRITRHFEYAWYGRFQVSTSAYERITTDVHELKSRLA
jgi:hypothetical protein